MKIFEIKFKKIIGVDEDCSSILSENEYTYQVTADDEYNACAELGTIRKDGVHIISVKDVVVNLECM